MGKHEDSCSAVGRARHTPYKLSFPAPHLKTSTRSSLSPHSCRACQDSGDTAHFHTAHLLAAVGAQQPPVLRLGTDPPQRLHSKPQEHRAPPGRAAQRCQSATPSSPFSAACNPPAKRPPCRQALILLCVHRHMHVGACAGRLLLTQGSTWRES